MSSPIQPLYNPYGNVTSLANQAMNQLPQVAQQVSQPPELIIQGAKALVGKFFPPINNLPDNVADPVIGYLYSTWTNIGGNHQQNLKNLWSTLDQNGGAKHLINMFSPGKGQVVQHTQQAQQSNTQVDWGQKYTEAHPEEAQILQNALNKFHEFQQANSK